MDKQPTGGWTKTPNEILDAMPDMSEAELKLTAVLIRQTYGYHIDEVKMTYDDMMTMAMISSRSSISDAIDRIEQRGFFKRGRRSMWIINSPLSVLNESENSPKSVLNEVYDSTESVLNESENSPKSVLNEVYDSTESVLLQSYKETPNGEGERKDAPAPATPNAFWAIPPGINTPEFVKVWADWLRYVDEGGITFTETQAVRALGKLADAGAVTATASVSRSIDRGWKNIHIEDVAAAVSLPGAGIGRNGQHPPGEDDTTRRLKARLAAAQQGGG